MSDKASADTGIPPTPGQRILNGVIDVVLIVFCILMLLPLVFLISNAFKSPQELLQWPPTIIPRDATLDNITSVLADTPLLRWITNTFFFAVLSTIAIVSTSAVSGYVLGKFKFPGVHIVFGMILATAIIPFEVYMIPLYLGVQQLGLLNSLWGLLIGYLVMSFGIFLIRQYVISSIPDELIEAARIDGASESWIFVRIVLPLLRGPLGTLAVLAFFQAWTAFTWPMIITATKDSYTLEVGLALFQTGFTVDLGRLSAAAALALLPSILFFAFMRRNFVQGVASSGLKE
ncbi:carbohydrate ABC transporter permease [Chelatococcus asaccharovorans]|uniref:Multiple sugar transport system permease protein n=1 Tax=Chelatococcus asaccharovorans TaxID=28210 RepID=A0A2V3UHD2_9HYPH|nr:carbohydrate ABC transporter permease [Chelatococcus asaccharovorans]MBS7702023.1 carbohydrate ABC transporter permease [Chelatococcus asaccharovorans]PXW64267.1 multiple sugar transport system permease protein [Chelatococcus asaccharovorans]CAH1667186.1 Multiple sugar transport system permease protein [Chelatococcus asaccharovorans]CAH1681099.1 Multiple sugar transport system permease protein [Chelatococcus asaccharovorans]